MRIAIAPFGGVGVCTVGVGREPVRPRTTWSPASRRSAREVTRRIRYDPQPPV